MKILFLFGGKKKARGDVKLFIFFLMIYIMHRLSILYLGTGGMGLGGSVHIRTFFLFLSICCYSALEVMKMLLSVCKRVSVVSFSARRRALVLFPF